MTGWAIVAIPEDRSDVWKLSSEKVPHMTILYFGAQDDELAEHIALQVQHTASKMLTTFGTDVKTRGELGDDKADVLFFDQRTMRQQVMDFRAMLLQDETIRRCYDSVDQYEPWTPHLTMGYPGSPAKTPDKNSYYSDEPIRTVHFDKIALWTEDFDGPTFDIDYQTEQNKSVATKRSPYSENGDMAMSDESREFLSHSMALAPRSYSHVPTPSNMQHLRTGSTSRSYIRPVMEVLPDALLNTTRSLSNISQEAASLRHSDVDSYEQIVQEELGLQIKHSVGGRDSETAHIRYDVATLPDGEWLISVINSLEHTGTAETRVRPYADADGLISSYVIVEDNVHENDLKYAIQHSGVKGMKWGVRRKPAVLEALRKTGNAVGRVVGEKGTAAGKAAAAKGVSVGRSAGAKATAKRTAFGEAREAKRVIRTDAKVAAKTAKTEAKATAKTAKADAKVAAKEAKRQDFKENFKRPVTPDAAEASQKRGRTKKHGTDALSNAELQRVVTRMNLEQQYATLQANEKAASARSSGKRYVGDIFKQAASELAKDAIKYAATEGVKSAFNKRDNSGPAPSRSNVVQVFPNALPQAFRQLPRGRS